MNQSEKKINNLKQFLFSEHETHIKLGVQLAKGMNMSSYDITHLIVDDLVDEKCSKLWGVDVIIYEEIIKNRKYLALDIDEHKISVPLKIRGKNRNASERLKIPAIAFIIRVIDAILIKLI